MVFNTTPTIRKAAISEESRAAFDSPSSPGWCRELLVDPNVQPLHAGWRDQDLQKTNEDSLLSGTLRTPDTIRAWQTLYRPLPPASAPQQDADDKSPVAGEVLCLVALGSGLNGHVDVAHGGITATILDVSMGTTCGLFSTEGDSTYTLELTIRYKKPLVTPGIYMSRTWLQKRTTGRKAWLKSTIEDGNGVVIADSDGFWLDVPAGSKL